MLELGLACDGGKDSLSMAANAEGEVCILLQLTDLRWQMLCVLVIVHTLNGSVRGIIGIGQLSERRRVARYKMPAK